MGRVGVMKRIVIEKEFTKQEGGNVNDSKVEEVHISCRPHVLVLGDDNAGDDIARDTNHKEDAVDDGEREECSPVNIWLAKTLLDK
jgi:hypothetical protein